jgi:hypothetical protein
MQPYFFPYLGYFQMVKSVDVFVFFDDVNFISRGWINRNCILLNNQSHYITVPLKKASQNKLINEVEVDFENKQYKNLLITIKQAYNKTPFFSQVYPIIEEIIGSKFHSISELSSKSIVAVSKYLGFQTQFQFSSIAYSHTKGLNRAERLIAICHLAEADNYINSIGGTDLYSKSFFRERGVHLKFIKPKEIFYKQFAVPFVPWLSIIDVLMFNEIPAINYMLNNFDLV